MFVNQDVPGYVNWMTLFGVGLITCGVVLLWVAVIGSGHTRLPRHNHGAASGPRRAGRPRIEQSALLGATVTINALPPPAEPVALRAHRRSAPRR